MAFNLTPTSALVRHFNHAIRNQVMIGPVGVAYVYWLHTPPLEPTHRIYEILQDLFDIARRPRRKDTDDATHIQNVSYAVARWHWLFADVCPYQRGSAAIGEILIAALFKAQGISAGKSNVAEGRDTFALTSTLEEYERAFATTFQSTES